MAGEINGTTLVIEVSEDNVDFDVIAGQLEVTQTRTGTPIDISNKSYGDNVTLLDGNLSADGYSVGGNFIFNTEASFLLMRDAQYDGKQLWFIMSRFGDVTRWKIKASVSGVGDQFPHGAAVSTSVTLTSSGAPVAV